jgi:hypothetical protein
MWTVIAIVIGIWWVASSVYVGYKGSRRRQSTGKANYFDPSLKLSSGAQLACFILLIILAPFALVIIGAGYLAIKRNRR